MAVVIFQILALVVGKKRKLWWSCGRFKETVLKTYGSRGVELYTGTRTVDKSGAYIGYLT